MLRVASQSTYPNHLGTTAAVRVVLREFCSDPRHEFLPDDVSLLDDDRLARPELLSPSRTTDLYLLALATRHRVRLATFDRRIPADAVAGAADTILLIDA